jgi:transcriptional regulator with XRE-family HTH domain
MATAQEGPQEASTGVPGGENAPQRRDVKFGQMLESLIERGGYTRNRKRILTRLGISGAALSQYIHEQTWPSFAKLLAIADFFDVSLDYLVYGQPASSSPVDYGPISRYFDHALANAKTRGNRHDAVVARIGRMITDRIDDVAAELAATPAAAREGLMQDDELLRLERYCLKADILSMNLEFEVIDIGGELAVGPFIRVMAENLGKGVPYRFLLPHDREWDVTVDACRRFLTAQAGGDRVGQDCRFRIASAPVLGGATFYNLDIGKLETGEPVIHEQIRDYLSEDNWLGCILRSNDDSSSDMLMAPAHCRRARAAFDRIWSSGTAV